MWRVWEPPVQSPAMDCPGEAQILMGGQILGISTLPARVKATLKLGLHSLYLPPGETSMGGGKQIIITSRS
jgi:hypothetical protein